MNVGQHYLLVHFYTRVDKKDLNCLPRVFLLHHPVLEDQSTEVSKSQGSLECLVRTFKGKSRIKVFRREKIIEKKMEKRTNYIE